jgi:non-ribosomal peptide synthetase component F
LKTFCRESFLSRISGLDISLPDMNQSESEGQILQSPKKSIAHFFSEQARKTPFRRALSFGSLTLTYRQLEERSNQVAHYLKSKRSKKKNAFRFV